MNTIKAELIAWHEQFAACVRGKDFEAARALFAPECQGFGTCVEFAADREHLLKTQWIPTWSSTHSFHFLPAPFEIILSKDGSLVCVLALWESQGVNPKGATFPRRGRCTTVLRRADANSTTWVAMHTHYSKTPDGDL